jgi:hypothetical protein
MINSIVLQLRGKISHSWLDHEVELVSDAVVMRRLFEKTWAPTIARWDTLYKIAIQFGEQFDQLTAAYLVDTLQPFDELPSSLRASLKQVIEIECAKQLDVAKIKEEYFAALGGFWGAWVTFKEAIANQLQVDSLCSSEPQLLALWHEVKCEAAKLKLLFSSKRIPSEIVMP